MGAIGDAAKKLAAAKAQQAGNAAKKFAADQA
jgi:hypothetical protein